MGGAPSQPIEQPPRLMAMSNNIGMLQKTDTETSIVEWKVLPSHTEARKKFEEDGTLAKTSDKNHLELRTMLDDNFSQSAIGKYADQIKSYDIFICWVNIQEFKSINTDIYRRSKARYIFKQFIEVGAPLEVGGIDPAMRERIKNDLELSETNPSVLNTDYFSKLQSNCFMAIYNNVYIPFKTTPAYANLSSRLKKKYNRVTVNDFEYYNKLGEGGFGFVIHCKKLSTGKHYAMKIQTKKGLIDSFKDDLKQVDYEKQAFASCQHPFIVNMDYAFQTPSLAIMVLGLATAGDLQKALNRSPTERLAEDRVMFYVAEVVLALSYLHEMGLMYRDLKPNNILLNEDGHIQLVDLGGVSDEFGHILGKDNDIAGMIPLFVQNFASRRQTGMFSLEDIQNNGKRNDDIEEAAKSSKKKKKLSIMGTFGYMAPEMIVLLHQSRHEQTGYTNAVDWWSLGITMFKLLTGYRPFTDDNFSTFVEMATELNEKVKKYCDYNDYAVLFQEINFPVYIGENARDLIKKLLNVDEKKRLGSGPNGVTDIKAHPFFTGIDWEALELKHLKPSFIPDRTKFFDDLAPHDFETAMTFYNKKEWLNEHTVPFRYQSYFQNWDFTSSNTIRIESGLTHAMDQLAASHKLKRLMGDDTIVNNKQQSGKK